MKKDKKKKEEPKKVEKVFKPKMRVTLLDEAGAIVSDRLEEYINNVYIDYSSRDNNYMYSYDSMFFDVMSDHKITYFDVPDNGNFGYDGINKMKVSDMKYKVEDFSVYYKE